jgi:hypothetical protein
MYNVIYKEDMMQNPKLPKYIFLFGHRQQHGKDTCCEMAYEMLSHANKSTKKTYFAKLLKQQVAERYGLDFDRMGDDDYKQWCPPHVNPKRITIDASPYENTEEIGIGSYISYQGKNCEIVDVDGAWSESMTILVPRTVRDILIEEGCKAREIWGDTWAAAVYTEIFQSGCDYRFPNESACFETCLRKYLTDKCGNEAIQFTAPKIVKVLVHRPDGVFKNDGADAELPDLDHDGAWDCVIMNDGNEENWRDRLEDQVFDMLREYGVL